MVLQTRTIRAQGRGIFSLGPCSLDTHKQFRLQQYGRAAPRQLKRQSCILIRTAARKICAEDAGLRCPMWAAVNPHRGRDVRKGN